MRLYERILQEAAQEKEKENPEQEKQQRRRAYKRQKMRAYIRSRRRSAVASSGGYVSSEEIQEEQERHRADLHALCNFMTGGVRSTGAGYRLAHLRNKCRVEYAHLRDIEICRDCKQ